MRHELPELENIAGRRSDALLLAGLVLATAVIRCAAIYYSGDNVARDPDHYRRYAESLLTDGTFLRNGLPSAWRPPLYPLLLAGCLVMGGKSLLWVKVLHAVAGIFTVWLAVLTARRWNLGQAALVAGLVLAVDPILVRATTELMTETIAALLAAVAIYCATRALARGNMGWTIASGASVGLAILCRPTFLVWGFCLLPLAGWIGSRQFRPRLVAIYALAVLAVLAPWAIRNSIMLGRPIVTTTHGGYTLLLGNNEYFYDFLKTRKRGQVWDSRQFVRDWERQLKEENVADEIGEDEFAYRLARRYVRENPQAFARASLDRLKSFWQLAPRRLGAASGLPAQMLRLAITFWYFAVFGLVLIGCVEFERQQKPHTWLVAILLPLSFTLVHLCYWTDMRMRSAVMPALALLAAAGWRCLAGYRRNRSSALAKT